MNVTTAKALYRWAYNKPEHYAAIETWLDSAVADLAAGKGREVASTSANGVSVAFQTASMTTADWFNTLSLALVYLDTKPVTKIRGRVG